MTAIDCSSDSRARSPGRQLAEARSRATRVHRARPVVLGLCWARVTLDCWVRVPPPGLSVVTFFVVALIAVVVVTVCMTVPSLAGPVPVEDGGCHIPGDNLGGSVDLGEAQTDLFEIDQVLVVSRRSERGGQDLVGRRCQVSPVVRYCTKKKERKYWVSKYDMARKRPSPPVPILTTEGFFNSSSRSTIRWADRSLAVVDPGSMNLVLATS